MPELPLFGLLLIALAGVAIATMRWPGFDDAIVSAVRRAAGSIGTRFGVRLDGVLAMVGEPPPRETPPSGQEAVAAEGVAPAAVEPEAVASEAVEAQAVEAQAVTPEAATPEAVAPEAATPEAAEPETAMSPPATPPPSASVPPAADPPWAQARAALQGWLRSVGDRVRPSGAAEPGSATSRPGRLSVRRPPAGLIEDAPVGERPQTAVRRILRGDRSALDAVAVGLADGDLVLAERWEARLERLFDAIQDRALEAGYVDPPRGDPFWAAFTVEQGRDVMKALGSLGFHVDGRGAWLDERVPTRRELSIAVGYAGIDPVRLRTWPTPEELAALGGRVVIAGADFLDVAAPGLTQAEVSAIVDGIEGEQGFDELWAEWDRLRPLLLAEA